MVDRVGERFGDYRLKRLLSNRGAFADVYEGEHVVDRTKAAVKIWKVQIEAKTFLNDVRAAVLRHPHIVEILDFNIKGDVPYLVMAYAPNGSLQAQPLPLPLDSIVAYVRQIADALSYAHQRGIVHRDIKPDNILLGPKQEIWVGDFGIATHSYTRQDTFPEGLGKHSPAGTPGYMAPEQWGGNASPASDQYALGILVYEWLCGKRPFAGDFFALGHQHTSVPPPLLHEQLPTISPIVEQVVMKALEKDWKKRYPTIQDFAHALDQAYQIEQQTIAPLVSRRSSPGTLLYSYQVPQGSVYSFSWMQNKPRLATRDADGKVEVRDLATGSLVFSTGEDGVDQIMWSPNGSCLAGLARYRGGETTKLHIWNPDVGKHLATYANAFEPLIWSPDGTRIAFLYDDEGSGGAGNLTFHIGSVDQTQLLWTFPASDEQIGAAKPVWSPDGKYIAFSPEHPSHQWVIPVYEVAKEDTMTTYSLQLPPPPPGIRKGRRAIPEGNLFWSPDSTSLANWAHYEWFNCSVCLVNRNDVHNVEKQRRAKEAYRAQRRVQIWTHTTQSELTLRSDVLALIWSPDSARIAFALGDQIVKIWDVATKNDIQTYWGHTESVFALAWSPDKEHIASISIDGKIHVWNSRSAKRVLMLESNFHGKSATLEWSSDGTQLALNFGSFDFLPPSYGGYIDPEDSGYGLGALRQMGNRCITYDVMLQIWQIF